MIDLERLAREAGFRYAIRGHWCDDEARQRFAQLVAEEAAKVCDSAEWRYDITGGQAQIAKGLAKDIREAFGIRKDESC